MATSSNEIIKEISNSVKSLFDLTSRIDERVKMLMEKNQEVSEKLKELSSYEHNLSARMSVLESSDLEKVKASFDDEAVKLKTQLTKLEIRLSLVEKDTHATDSRWKFIVSSLYHAALTIAIFYILYRMGIPV